MMETTTVDATTLRDKLSEILRDEHYSVAGLARSMNLDPETLAAWQREEFDGDNTRVERIVGKFLEAREAFWRGIRQGNAHAVEGLKATLILGLTEVVSRLVRDAGVSRQAELNEAQAYVLLRDLELASKAAPGCNEVNCWRCGADISRRRRISQARLRRTCASRNIVAGMPRRFVSARARKWLRAIASYGSASARFWSGGRTGRNLSCAGLMTDEGTGESISRD